MTGTGEIDWPAGEFAVTGGCGCTHAFRSGLDLHDVPHDPHRRYGLDLPEGCQHVSKVWR